MMHFLARLAGISWAILATIMLAIIILGVVSGARRTD